MRSVLIHDELETLNTSLRDISRSIRWIVKTLANERKSDAALDSVEIDRLKQLNKALRNLENFLVAEACNTRALLSASLNAPDRGLADIEITARIDYMLRENDAEWREDNSNILTSRTHITPEPPLLNIDDTKDWCDRPENPLNEPHCWLFHDLYDHGCSEEQVALSLKDCARIGRVWTELEFRQQFAFNIENGNWK